MAAMKTPSATSTSPDGAFLAAEGWRDRALRARMGWRGLMLLMIAAGLAWRAVRYFAGFPIWGDEASLIMSLLSRDFAGLARPPLEVNQIAPLGYMWLELALARIFGYGEWVLRLPALVAAMASVVLMAWLARRVLDRRGALLAVAIFAASYYPVRHGAEVKPYSLDLLMGLCVTALAWRTARRPESIARWAALALAAAGAIWMSFPAVFAVGGAGLYLGWHVLRREGPRRAWAGLGIYALAAAASFIAMYLLYAKPLAASSPGYFGATGQWASTWPPVSEPWKLPLWFLETHAGNMLAYPMGGKNGGSAATLLLALAGCVVLWRRRRRGILLLLLLGPMFLNLLAALLKKYPYGGTARTMLFLAPAFCLLAGAGLASGLEWLSRRRGKNVPLVAWAAGMLATVAGVGAAIDLATPFKDIRYREIRDAIRSLADQSGPADRWVVANAIQTASDDIPALEGSGIQTFRYYVRRWSPGPAEWGPDPRDIQPGNGRLWLFCYDDPLKTEDAPGKRQRMEEYVRTVRQRLGPSQERRFVFHSTDKSRPPRTLTVHRFDAQPAAREAGAAAPAGL
jgi:hypothetical protein